jgi:hypothetical protein
LLGDLPHFCERCLSGRRGFCRTVVATDRIERTSRLSAVFCRLGKTPAQIFQILFQRLLASAHLIDFDGFTFLTQLSQRQSVTFLGEYAHDPDAFAPQFTSLVGVEDRGLEFIDVFCAGGFLKALNRLARFAP